MRDGTTQASNRGSRIRVQSWAAADRSFAALEELVQAPWPTSVGAVALGHHRVLCVGPTDWLLVTTDGAVDDLMPALQRAAIACAVSMADLSQGLEVLTVAGPQAREILAKGCGLDTHPNIFASGRCARTRWAHVPAIIECRDLSPRFDCYVSRSYAEHVVAWLKDATVEFSPRS